MKACPSCGRLYPEDAGFCPVDGSGLISATQVPIAPDGDDPRLGQLVCERYQLRRVVADGGMGRVYEALDMVERRNVAVKVLHAEVARDPVQVERFKREFEVSKQLPHDHIVEVYDFSATSEDTYVLVMEFLYGEELRATLDREKCIAPARIVRMISQIAIGLDKAHAARFVHRDLKPDNVFLCQTSGGDIVKLLDFGSVKDKAEGAKKLTVMGTTIGSPYYMAPEQAQGLDTLDHRADVWALGAIVYEAVSGSVPFSGVNGPQILLQILTKEAVPVSEKGKDARYPVPHSLDDVLGKAFKKAAALRYASVGELADAIGQAYGLDGDHASWATAPEGELLQLIESKMPRLLAQPKQEKRRTAQDDFFGEGDALGEQDGPTRDDMAKAMRAASPSQAPQSQVVPAIPGASTGAVPMWVYVVGGLAVLAILMLVLL